MWDGSIRITNSFLRVKIRGHQWYWTYEICDFLGLEYDSYIKGLDYYILGDSKFLEVDNRLILPVNYYIHFILRSSDVIHSWALPRFFIKLDVLSGIITVFDFFFNLIGIFFGQCSEICGANHSFIPIVVELVLFDFFKFWVLNFS